MAGIDELKKEIKKIKEQLDDTNTKQKVIVFESGCSTDFESREERKAHIDKTCDEILKNRIADPKERVAIIPISIGLISADEDGRVYHQYRNRREYLDGEITEDPTGPRD